MARILIVDENDKVIGAKESDDLMHGDTYRAAALWVTNFKGEVLMAKRAFTKKKSPGKWGPAVAGTIEEGEGYDENIVKEAGEEIGLNVSIRELKRGPKIRIRGEHNYFAQWYLYEVDKPVEEFSIQESEVAEIKWFSKNELKAAFEKSPRDFIESTPQWIHYFINL